MATKADFTAEEWGKLLGSPMVVGMVITAAEPSGFGFDKSAWLEAGLLSKRARARKRTPS